MNIGIIGAGNIGASLARKLASAGHVVKLANSRGPESLQDIVQGTDVIAATKEDAVRDADVIILSVPYAKMPELAALLADVPASTIVVDTSNYYPARDQAIAEVDNGKPETLWSSEQIGRPLVKAWNALLAQTLDEAGSEAETPDRIAIPIAGDDPVAKAVVSGLVSETGFDTVDAGTLTESWRLQPGTPAYCTELSAEDLKAALGAAQEGLAPSKRDAIMQSMVDGSVPFNRAAMIANNRAMTGSITD
ncbi:3-hydroxyisobutyrate dehydrogenase [Neorhizobium lilium]|uniref:3-hydroxyisobutyrate dehydrogenase n=1 Tax=Neorhizobium lilium TaxID=2503024 RepID=A0A444LLZ7_9HYPH|nr:3-hydroxyisobutyrate dehydrogenase [Neorhizobium lilium]